MFREVTDLFSSALRLKVAVFFARRPGERGGAADVAATVGASRGAVQRELGALSRMGLIKGKKIGRSLSYTLVQRHPFAAPLARFAIDTLTPADKKIADAFRPISGVMLVVTTGLLKEETKGSVDLLIVSRKTNARRIARAVKKVETSAAFPLRYAALDMKEYQERREAHDRLLRDVFEYKHTVVLERGSL